MTFLEIRRLVKKFHAPYSAIGVAFLKACYLERREGVPNATQYRKKSTRRRDVIECFEQRIGVEL